MGELWAFPTMLRLGILDSLANVLGQLIHTEKSPKLNVPSITDDNLVGNCITSLRMLAIQDWKSFFESTCVVEQVLRADPARSTPRWILRHATATGTAIEKLCAPRKATRRRCRPTGDSPKHCHER